MMNKTRKAKFLVAALALLPLTAWAEYGLNMPRGVTDFSQNVYDLHMIIFWICVAIAVAVFGAMIVSMVRDRKSKGAVAEQFSHSTKAEVIWTVIPIFILIAMAIPSTYSLIEMEEPKEMEMTIKVTGYQWLWKYEYKDDDLTIISRLDNESNFARQLGSGINPATVDNYLLNVDRPLVIPANTNIRFLLTSNDVNHAWWVPEFGWKRDAIPGFINQAWTNVKEPGVYRGQCAELCGRDHGFMPIVVQVLSKNEYAAWVAEQKGEQVAEATLDKQDWSQQDLMVRGEDVYADNCQSCHQPDGTGMSNAFPSLVASELVEGEVSEQIHLILHGKEGTAMRAFKHQLSDADIAAVVTYTRNTFKQADQTIQPTLVREIKTQTNES